MTLLIRKPGENDWHSPKVTSYEDEQRLQELIERSPDLLPGVASGPVIVAREVQVPDTGAVDLIGVDSAGNITLVECKLRANPEIRRHVIGQLLAYAAGLWRLTYEEFDSVFSVRAGKPLRQQVLEASEAAGAEWDDEGFQAAVQSNLSQGRFRLVLVVDEITEELKRIVEYLNERTGAETEILALELGYVADEGVEILVPHVYGEETARRKGRPGRRWDEESFFQELESRASKGAQAVRRLYDFAAEFGHSFSWGSGPNPSVTAWFEIDGERVPTWTCIAWTDRPPALDVMFVHLRDKVSTGKLRRLVEQLQRIPGAPESLTDIEQAGFNRKPAFPVDEVLASPGAVELMEEAIRELVEA